VQAAATDDSLTKLYQRWPTERLVEALHVHAAEYDPDALPVMRRVLEARGVGPTDAEALLAEIRSEEHRSLNRIRGWLLAFVVLTGWSSLNQVSSGLTGNTGHWLSRVVAVFEFCIGVYGLYATVLLCRRSPRAPAHAGRWAVVSATVGCAFGLVDWAIIGHPLAIEMIVSWPAFAIVWLMYLHRSRRVATVYGPSPLDGFQGNSLALIDHGPVDRMYGGTTEDLQVARSAEHDSLNRIRGWLVLFIAVVFVASLILIRDAVLALEARVNWPATVGAALVLLCGVYGCYSAVLLGRRAPRALGHAARWIVLFLALVIGNALLAWMLAGIMPTFRTLLSIIAPLMWIGYLTNSKRVAAVYGTSTWTAAREDPVASSIVQAPASSGRARG
jgi:hypothetical protein